MECGVDGYCRLFTVYTFQYKGNKVTGNKHAGKDSSSVHSPFRIAYFEMDSVENNFNMVKDVKAEIAKKEEEYTNSFLRLNIPTRIKYSEYQQKKNRHHDPGRL